MENRYLAILHEDISLLFALCLERATPWRDEWVVNVGYMSQEGNKDA